jgi:two-component system, OmpR family, sensor histidine kinase KdpD
MTAPGRPDPDALLARVVEEESRARRGRLKLFFGAAPGVGKTYTMLEAARAAKAEGVDVVAGVVETHRRAETQRLLDGLEVLPRRTVEYHGTTLAEFDLDGALARRPALILVDELAHTNAPGSRHAKRWQDVEELLGAGISVYTTLNVQHIESLNDVVAQITGVVVRETVPDAVFEQADEVELVDISAEVLLERLREGKVYVPEQAARALEQFFREGNLIALRELALRRTAERVEAQMQGYRAAHGIDRTWPAAERLLVCIGPNPASARLIRSGRRMAAALHADWIVLHVESSRQRLSASDRDALGVNLRLAEQLGARTATISADDVAAEILSYARSQNVSRILAGKPTHGRWRDRLVGSLLDRLIRGSRELDVYVITGEVDEGRPAAARREPPPVPAGAFLRTAAVVAAAGALGLGLRSWVNVTDIAMLFLLAVMVSAAWDGARPAILASVLAIALFDFVFVPPYYTFAVADASYVVTFAVMLVVALSISRLAARIRGQADAAREREQHTAALYALSRRLADARNASDLAEAVSGQVHETFGAPATVLLPDDAGGFAALAGGPAAPGAAAQGVARWVLEHGQPAGIGTDTLPGADALYLPITSSGHALGVLRVECRDARWARDPIERQLLEAIADQAGIAFERAALAARSEQEQMATQAERLRTSLLSSLSHDLRTPLAGIEGAASALKDGAEGLSPEARAVLAQTILEEARRMMRLVSNLLEMVRVESGALQVQQEWQSVEEVIGVALLRLEERLRAHPIHTDVPADLPLVPMDGLLVEQALVNLLENAAKYSPEGATIEVTAALDAGQLVIGITDRGPGVSPGEEERIFEKFYRSTVHEQVGGAGLGLTIVRAIALAHGGRVWVEPRAGGGSVFRLALPLGGTPPSLPVEDDDADDANPQPERSRAQS